MVKEIYKPDLGHTDKQFLTYSSIKIDFITV